jgi:predicted ABC-type ATPase
MVATYPTKGMVFMKIYTIIAGVNGCGKSSLTGVLKTEIGHLGKIVDVDKITAACGGNALEGDKQAVKLIDECLEKEICFTQETTLSGKKTLDTIKRAIEKDYHIRLYYVGLDTLEESLLRIDNRVKKGGHHIAPEAVARRFAKRFDDLLMVLPYCDEATFYDNDNGFVPVAKYKNGELHFMAGHSPKWLQELTDKMT